MISIVWSTGVITIPQSYLTPIGGTLYELNLDQFRLDLKSLEDDEDGMAWPATHTHNTELTLAGTTFARAIAILAPYTVTFEDGQYGVNLVGANSNLLDRLNRNQVSVASANSAGLIVTEGGGAWSTPRTPTVPGSFGEALRHLFLVSGLDPANPMVTDGDSRRVPADGSLVNQTVVTVGDTTTVTTEDP